MPSLIWKPWVFSWINVRTWAGATGTKLWSSTPSSSDEMPDSINGSLSGSTTGTGRHNLIRKCPSDLHILAKTLRALLEHVRNHICKYIYLPEGMFMYFSVTQTWEVPLIKAFWRWCSFSPGRICDRFLEGKLTLTIVSSGSKLLPMLGDRNGPYSCRGCEAIHL